MSWRAVRKKNVMNCQLLYLVFGSQGKRAQSGFVHETSVCQGVPACLEQEESSPQLSQRQLRLIDGMQRVQYASEMTTEKIARAEQHRIKTNKINDGFSTEKSIGCHKNETLTTPNVWSQDFMKDNF